MVLGGDGSVAARPSPRYGGAEDFLGDPTVGLRPNFWNRD